MIIIKVKSRDQIEQALKQYKFKVYKTKQTEQLRDRQEFTKKSVKRRAQKQKAVYLHKNKINFLDSCFQFSFLFGFGV
jgi:small subunit ribosomal protein S21